MSSNEDIYFGHDETTESLSAQLPEYMPKDPESGNQKMLSTIADRLDAIKRDVDDIDRAKSVQTAFSIDQLDRLARLVGLKKLENESLEHYRARIIAEFQLVTSEATIEDLLQAASIVLQTDKKNLKYYEPTFGSTENGTLSLNFPDRALDRIEFTAGELAEILDSLIPAGYRLDAVKSGTLTYLSPADYSGSEEYDSTQLNSDPDLGHDGLDSNGDPKDNGGTYAGLIG